jgi:hypothetical protein
MKRLIGVLAVLPALMPAAAARAEVSEVRVAQQYGTSVLMLGRLKTLPESWKDLFFPEIHQLPGG